MKALWNWAFGTSTTTVAAATGGGNIRDTIDALKLRRVKAQREYDKFDKEAQLANARGAKGKDAAMAALRRRKFYADQIKQHDATIANLEKAGSTVEGASIAADVHVALKSAASDIKQKLATVDIGEIEATTDDLDDGMRETADIMAAISRPIGVDPTLAEEDDEAIRQQLAEWDEEHHIVEVEAVDKLLPTLPKLKSTGNDGNGSNNNGNQALPAE
jgi:hypothetical protein